MTTTTSTASIVGRDTSTPHELPERCTIPWRTGLRLGCGIDSISATAAPSPLVRTKAEIVHQPPVEYIFVSVAHDLDATLRAAFAVRDHPFPTLGHLGLRAWSMAKALALVEPFKPSVTLLIWWERISDIARLSTRPLPSMTADALAVYQASPKRFREKFGDYYVSGAKRGSRFAAILTISYEEGDALKAKIDQLLQSPKPLHEVDSELKNSLVSPVVQSIDTCVFRLLDTSEPKIVEHFSLSARNSDSSPFSACIARLRTLSGTSNDHILAELAHYSTHSGLSTLPRTIPLEGRDLRRYICDLIEDCLIRVTSIPERIAHHAAGLALHDRVSSLLQSYIDINSLIVKCDFEVLVPLQQCVEDLKEFFDVYDVWAELAIATFSMPQTPGVLCSHGMTESEGYFRVVVQTWVGAIDGRFFRSRLFRRTSEVTQMRAPPGTHIVGWTVTAGMLIEGSGYWETVAGSRLLQPAVRFLIVQGRRDSYWIFKIHCASHKYLDALAECYREDLEQLSAPFSYHRSASLM